ncbi:MAG: glycoside hydrolase N-terminal domain-containing protein [Chitinophagaceae bacterium]
MTTKKITYFIIALLTTWSAGAQDLQLWYTQPAVKWTEALPLGNGRIGAMVFGGSEQDRIQFNEETLWTGKPRSYSRPGAWHYLDSIRQLLFGGKQKEAEALAEKEFMGTKSHEGGKEQWLKEILSLKGMNGNPALQHYDDSKWKAMQVPSYEGWEAAGFEGLDGAVWLRTSFDMPFSWLGKDVALDVNRIRDYDLSYVNGVLIGTQQNGEPRKYVIPKAALHAGRNTIAIQVINYFDKGGIAGYKDTSKHIGVFPVGEESGKISLNGAWKYFIQNDEPPEVGEYQASYQPFGDLWLQFKHEAPVTDYKRSLNISDAVAVTSYTCDGIYFNREYLVSQPNQVLAIHLTASQKRHINFEASLTSPHRNFTVKKIDNHTVALSVKVRNGVLRGKSYLQVTTVGGTMTVEGGKMIIHDADAASIYLTAGTSFKNYKDVSADPVLPCTNALKSIAAKTYAQVKAAHVKEYQQYFNTYSVNLGKSENESLPTDIRLQKFASSNDPAFVALYQQYGRYLLIASSRPGTKPANLQGIWNDLLVPPWGSKYTTNINLEMNYWPAELLNLSPMHQPLFGMIDELAQTGHQTAADHYHAPGWVLHHNTDLWRGTAPINASNHGIWVTGGAWLCEHLWDHYLFTQDKDFLRTKAYPVMKQAALFFNDFLVKDPTTGFLISTPSNSPEQGGLVAGPTMDHEIIRNLFQDVINASKILNTDAALRDTLKIKYQQIAPLKIGKYGQLQEWMKDIDDTSNKHRHISHLWGMYPGHEINLDESPALMEAARQSLIYRGDAATGWSLGWKINCWARFKDGDHAFKMIQMLMTPANGNAGSYPNLFDAHPPFQIDGNFGGAAGIGEMIIQSHTKYLDILPALPAALPSGEVKGICARGGFVLGITWRNGKLYQVTVRSKAGMPLLLRYNGTTKMISTTKNGVYKFDASLKQL